MKIYKYTIFTVILFLICITNTYAACTQEERNEFKKNEDEYTVKYEFNKTSKLYDLYLTGKQSKKYAYSISLTKELECSPTNDTTIKCINFPPNEYTIEITGNTSTCDDVLKTITLKLPKYNKYSEDPLCNGIEEFVLCNPTYDKEIDYENFVSRVETYKKTKDKQEENNHNQEINKEEDTNYISIVKDYVEKNLLEIIIVMVFIVLVIITTIVTARSIRKSRRLE